MCSFSPTPTQTPTPKPTPKPTPMPTGIRLQTSLVSLSLYFLLFTAVPTSSYRHILHRPQILNAGRSSSFSLKRTNYIFSPYFDARKGSGIRSSSNPSPSPPLSPSSPPSQSRQQSSSPPLPSPVSSPVSSPSRSSFYSLSSLPPSSPLTSSPEWQSLLSHSHRFPPSQPPSSPTHLRNLVRNPTRAALLHAEAEGVILDYSRQRVDVETVNLLVKLAERQELGNRIEDMVSEGGGGLSSGIWFRCRRRNE